MAKFTEKPEKVVIWTVDESYSDVRNVDAKNRKNIFNQLKKHICEELEFDSDIGCYYLFKIYQEALEPIVNPYISLISEYRDVNEKLEAFNDYALENLANAKVTVKNVIFKMTEMLDNVNRWKSAFKNLLEPDVDKSIYEYKAKIAFYKKLYGDLSGAFLSAKTLLDKIDEVSAIQANLYGESSQEQEIKDAASNALATVDKFFGLINDGVFGLGYKNDEKPKAKIKKDELSDCCFESIREAFSNPLRELEEIKTKYNDQCSKRLHEDIDSLKLFTERVEPRVPRVDETLFTINSAYSHYQVVPKMNMDKLPYEKVATLTVQDILQAYGTEAGAALLGKDIPLLSLAALKELNLISDDAERIKIVDGGCLVDRNGSIAERLRKDYISGKLLEEKQSVYISKNAYNLIF